MASTVFEQQLAALRALREVFAPDPRSADLVRRLAVDAVVSRDGGEIGLASVALERLCAVDDWLDRYADRRSGAGSVDLGWADVVGKALGALLTRP